MPDLRKISLDEVRNLSDSPTLRIKTDEDVETWKKTQSYMDYSIFLQRLADSVVNCFLPWSPEVAAPGPLKLLALLDKLDKWIEDIPPLQTPQRFGNLAFRKWGQRLEEECDVLLEELLETEFGPTSRFVKPYLMTSFGSFTRMDYGTGHETSFALFLLCLTLVRFFDPVPEVERQLVLVVFLRYLRLCWKLQDFYRLEPAGSHGVWGLDDSHFLPYIFGSAELRDQNAIPVSAILQTALPSTNLYFLSISRIHEVKHGPFHEHSSSLHAIAVGVPNWGKVNSGLFKMYEAEVLSKRVVVQHIPLGGLLEWDASFVAHGVEENRHVITPVLGGLSTSTTLATVSGPSASSGRQSTSGAPRVHASRPGLGSSTPSLTQEVGPSQTARGAASPLARSTGAHTFRVPAVLSPTMMPPPTTFLTRREKDQELDHE